MRILVVEDDKKIASFVIKGLKQSGFAAEWPTLDTERLGRRFTEEFAVLPLLEESLEEALLAIAKRTAGKGADASDRATHRRI